MNADQMTTTLRNDFPNTTIVSWTLTTTCNYNCHYCVDELHDGKYRWPDIDSMNNFLKRLSSKSRVHCEVLGGEPTLWPELITFLRKHRYNENITFEISSNGSRSMRWWGRFVNNVSKHSILTLSFHGAEGNVDHFVNVVKFVSQHFNVCVCIMLDPSSVEKCYKVGNDLIEGNVSADVYYKSIRPKMNSRAKLIKGYTKEMLDKIRAGRVRNIQSIIRPPRSVPGTIFINEKPISYPKMLVNRSHRFKGWKCWAGNKRFIVDPDGWVHPCQQLTFNLNPLYQMFNINDPDSYYSINDDTPLRCPVEFCSCKSDALVKKERDFKVDKNQEFL